MEVAEVGSETAIKSSSSKTVVEQSSSSLSSLQSMSLSEKSVQSQQISVKSSQQLTTGITDMSTSAGDELAALTKDMTALMDNAGDAADKQLVSSGTSVSSSSSVSAVSVIKKSSASVVSSSATQNSKAAEEVQLEDCPEAGDANTASATTTVTIVKQKSLPTAPSEEEEEVEEIIEVVEGDEDGDTIEVTETVQVVKQQEVAQPTTTKTVTVIKKQASQDGSNGNGTTTTTTTTTVVRKASVAEAAPETQTIKTSTTTTEEPSTVTTKVNKSIITTTPPTVTSGEKQVAVAAEQKQQQPQQPQEELVEEEEVEGEEETEGEGDDEEVEETEEDAENDGVQSVQRKVSISTAKPQQAAGTPAAAIDTEDAAQQQQQKQDNLNNTLKEIISDIDRDIEQQEDVAKLKAQQLELLKQQQALAQQIRQQQLLSQQLAAQNELQQQQLQQQQTAQKPQDTPVQQQLPSLTAWQAPTNVSKTSAVEESQNENDYTRKNESYEVEESSNISKRIDLQKIFTPATDAEEILPKNRKLYASSAFYSPALHPTVEDQVELARRISHSLSDISNQQSKGQSMYVNRKKRSVKWVHEGSGKAKMDSTTHDYEYNEESKENSDNVNDMTAHSTTNTATGQGPLMNIPLKLVMNPRGQIRDFNSARESLNTESCLMSPDKCAELVTDLNTQKGKGAELFAKRRRKAEKWVVDETNAGSQSPSGLPDYHQYQPKPATSPSIVPAYSDAGKHRVQMNLHQEQLLEKYAKPGLKVVKTPWEAALETGSASSAFVEEHKLSPYFNQSTPTVSPAPAPQYLDNRGPSPYHGTSATDGGSSYADFSPQPYQQQHKLPQAVYQTSKPSAYNSTRDLAYKPNIAQGWKAPTMTLPKELYVPKEIPLDSYDPPPTVASNTYSKPLAPTNSNNTWSPAPAASLPSSYSTGQTQQQYPSSSPPQQQYAGSYPGYAAAPQSKPQPSSQSPSYGYAATYAPPKQPYLKPTSYQTVPQLSNQAPPVSFNPSPLPYDKLAKFENPSPPESYSPGYVYSPHRALGVPGSKVRNVSPAPFGCDRSNSSRLQSYPPASPQSQQYGSYGTAPGYTNGSSMSGSYQPSTADMSQCQNFNNAARGWSSGRPGAGFGTTKQAPIAAAGHLPYTDF